MCRPAFLCVPRAILTPTGRVARAVGRPHAFLMAGPRFRVGLGISACSHGTPRRAPCSRNIGSPAGQPACRSSGC
jgi:hypothetical protein